MSTLLREIILLSAVTMLFCCKSLDGSTNNTHTKSTFDSTTFRTNISKGQTVRYGDLTLKKMTVFGIDIFADVLVSDRKMLHSANVLAQYLDNDEDGKVDSPLLLENLVSVRKAFIFIWHDIVTWDESINPKIMNIEAFSERLFVDLGAPEIHPEFVSGGLNGSFDTSLEEILHLLTEVFPAVSPKTFDFVYSDEGSRSYIQIAMDRARGGRFKEIPSKYPDSAWFFNDDESCYYDCMAVEYFYWALTTYLGAHENRYYSVMYEWKLNTKDKLKARDSLVVDIIENSPFPLPNKKLPDGKYPYFQR